MSPRHRICIETLLTNQTYSKSPMKTQHKAALAILALTILTCLFYCTPDRTQPHLRISNSGDEIIEMQTAFSGCNTTVHLGKHGIRTFQPETTVQLGESKIRVNGSKIEIVHTGQEILNLSYTDASGNQRRMMLGDGATGYFHNPNSIVLGSANIQLLTIH